MKDLPRKEETSQDLTDHLIAISVVSRHLARKLEELKRAGEKDHEQNE